MNGVFKFQVEPYAITAAALLEEEEEEEKQYIKERGITNGKFKL